MKFNVITNEGIREVEGRPVKFRGFKEFDFIAHRSCTDNLTWRVTELRSGAYISLNCEWSLNYVLRSVKHKLKNEGKERVIAVINQFIKEHGLANSEKEAEVKK